MSTFLDRLDGFLLKHKEEIKQKDNQIRTLESAVKTARKERDKYKLELKEEKTKSSALQKVITEAEQRLVRALGDVETPEK